jgi:putative sigma-54 modulation protein
MVITITGRSKLNVSSALEARIKNKLGKLSKFFGEDSELHVVLSKEKERNIAEATVYHKGMIFRAEESSYDMYSSIDKVGEILERQIRKNRTRLEKKLKESAFVPDFENDALYEVEEEKEYNIVKNKKIAVKPMSLDEAVLQMNLLGHMFFLFNDEKNGNVNVVYKRKNGGYGLIEVN